MSINADTLTHFILFSSLAVKNFHKFFMILCNFDFTSETISTKDTKNIKFLFYLNNFSRAQKTVTLITARQSPMNWFSRVLCDFLLMWKSFWHIPTTITWGFSAFPVISNMQQISFYSLCLMLHIMGNCSNRWMFCVCAQARRIDWMFQNKCIDFFYFAC